MSIDKRIQSALRSVSPAINLRTLVNEMAQEGCAKTEIYKRLEGFVVQHRGHADFSEAEEDVIMDVLDGLGGWCHPSAELLREKP